VYEEIEWTRAVNAHNTIRVRYDQVCCVFDTISLHLDKSIRRWDQLWFETDRLSHELGLPGVAPLCFSGWGIPCSWLAMVASVSRWGLASLCDLKEESLGRVSPMVFFCCSLKPSQIWSERWIDGVKTKGVNYGSSLRSKHGSSQLMRYAFLKEKML
jgi:hypothetical protein